MDNKSSKIKKRYNRIAPFYDRLEGRLEEGRLGTWRKRLWQRVSQKIPDPNPNNQTLRLLDAGVGTGKNIPYYPQNAEIYAVDFSRKMLEKAEARAGDTNRDIHLQQMDIEDLSFPDQYFDIIVVSCVFCSVPNPVKGLQELKRVCKQDGRIYMLEHMRTEEEPWGILMDLFNWVSLSAWGGNINRRTMEYIDKADLNIIEKNDLFYDVVKEIILTP